MRSGCCSPDVCGADDLCVRNASHQILPGPRVPYALSLAGLLPPGLARISASGVPAVAILTIGVWSIVLAVSGTFDILTDMYIFILWVFFGMSGAAVFILRHRLPNADRPYRVWGYPYVPALFLLVTAYLLDQHATGNAVACACRDRFDHRGTTGIRILPAPRG